MPSRNVHKVVGAVVGATAALATARRMTQRRLLMAALGGAVFGAFGGQLPDIIEPADSPNHRNSFHSATTAVALSALTAKNVEAWQNRCYDAAEYFQWAKESNSANGVEEFLYSIMELTCEFAAGMFPGFAAGYVSHIVMDGHTAKGLPLL